MQDNEPTRETPVQTALLPRLSRKQSQAALMAEQAQLRTRWKAALPFAREAWAKLSPEELQQSGGNVHRIAGLIQLRYHLSREDADLQVRTFMDARVRGA